LLVQCPASLNHVLQLHARGNLPEAFVVTGGWNEVAVAVLAIAVAFVPLSGPLRRHAILIWNTVGFVELLAVLAVAVQIGATQPWYLRPFRVLPLDVLPLFLVPLLFATHVIIFVRMGREPTQAGSPA
jgi:hypothetical protein